MPLPPSGPKRALKHIRSIDVQAYARDDGLWDIEAHITDTKTRPMPLTRGIRAAGDPIHDLSLRITIDTQFNILEAHAVSDATPYPGSCDQVGPQYQRLVGLNLMRGFRHEVRERLSGTQGCTHLSELTQVLPTAVIQAFAGDVIDTVESKNPDGSVQMPFQLGKCRALRTDGPVVAQFYPRWAVANADDRQDEESPILFQSASIRKLA